MWLVLNEVSFCNYVSLSRVVAPATKSSEVVDDDDTAGIDRTSKIKRIKTAPKVATSSSVEEQERGILPSVKLWCPSCATDDHVTGNVSWYHSLPMPRRARMKP